MPRRREPPRLYFDQSRQQWVIRDGQRYIRTGCGEHDRDRAEAQLRDYLGRNRKPQDGANPLIADILLAYLREHVPHVRDQTITYTCQSLVRWWQDKRLAHITAANCRAYAADHPPGAARKHLEALRAAINHWHREHGPIMVPAIVLPKRGPPRDRWLTRSEAARLLWAARHHDPQHAFVRQHLTRFILIGLATGSRRSVILSLRWDQIDLEAGIMHRRAAGKAEDARKRTPPVRLGRKILTHLRRWRRLDGPFARHVCASQGQVLKTLAASWPSTVERAGLSGKVTPHTLRHTRATWLMQAGVDIWEAAASLGMTTTMLERTYGHHHPNWQRKAAEV